MYQLTLRKESLNRNKTTAIHIIAALVLIVTGFIAFVTPFSIQIFMAGKEGQSAAPTMNWLNYGGGLLALFGLFIIIRLFFFTKKSITTRTNLLLRLVEIACFGAILLISILYQYHLTAVYAAVMLLLIFIIYYIEQVQLKQHKVVAIDESGIGIISKIKNTHWKWNEIRKVILKNSVLTVMLYDQKSYQLLLQEISKDETIINQYAQDQIAANASKRNTNDW